MSGDLNTSSFINIINSKVSKKSVLIRQYVEVINVLLNLSNRELDVLALLIEIDLGWNEYLEKNILDTTSRKHIMKETLMNKANLSRYLSILKGRNAIVKIKDGWCINEKLLPVLNNNKITIHFNLSLDE